MALFDHTRRRGLDHDRRSGRMNIDDMMRSTDVTLYVVIIVLLIAFAFGSWYFYRTMGVDNTGTSTATEPVTTHPASSPSPGSHDFGFNVYCYKEDAEVLCEGL
jgi:hypothetical protein